MLKQYLKPGNPKVKAEKFFTEFTYDFINIKKYLFNLPPKIKRAKALTNLSKIYWDKGKYENSLEMILEINKTKPHSCLEPLLFSLIYYQTRHTKPGLNYTNLVETYFSGWPKKIAMYRFLSHNTTDNRVLFAFEVIKLWHQHSPDPSYMMMVTLFKEKDDQEINSKLAYFIIMELCNTCYVSNTNRLVDMALLITHKKLKLNALKHIKITLKDQIHDREELDNLISSLQHQ